LGLLSQTNPSLIQIIEDLLGRRDLRCQLRVLAANGLQASDSHALLVPLALDLLEFLLHF
jgi:hypothetical protein